MIYSILSLLVTASLAQNPTRCDELYVQRGMNLFAAANCYMEVLPQADFEGAMVSLSGVVQEFKAEAEERQAIDQGLALVEAQAAKFGMTPEVLYWRACMKSFDAQRRDRGAMIPRATMAVLKSIQIDLTQALELKPEIHAFGPHRVLGLIHIELPRVLGGDRFFAEKNLEASFKGAPRLSANWIAYARSLMVLGKRDLAKDILNAFLLLPDSELNPYSEALRFPKFETDADRVQAKKLLEQL
jgi:hypothetical protein